MKQFLPGEIVMCDHNEHVMAHRMCNLDNSGGFTCDVPSRLIIVCDWSEKIGIHNTFYSSMPTMLVLHPQCGLIGIPKHRIKHV